MVLSIELFRNPETKLQIIESQQKRFKSTEVVDEVVEIDGRLCTIRHQNQSLRTELKKIQKDLGLLNKAKKGQLGEEELNKIEADIANLLQTKTELEAQVDRLTKDETEYNKK